MRAPVVGLIFADRLTELFEATSLVSVITHAHAVGIEGAVLIAHATALALSGTRSLDAMHQVAARCSLEPFVSRLAVAQHGLSPATMFPVSMSDSNWVMELRPMSQALLPSISRFGFEIKPLFLCSNLLLL